jgi:hypothetical protein
MTSIDNINSESKDKLGQREQTNNIDFWNTDKLFSSLQNKDNISKEFFDKQIKEFHEKTWEQYFFSFFFLIKRRNKKNQVINTVSSVFNRSLGW